MAKLYIDKQTEAEKDSYLYKCFHDSGIIEELVSSNYTILSGRKGMGKTAIAKYLEKKHAIYGLDFTVRLSIRNFNTTMKESEQDTLDSILSYIIIRSVQKMLNTSYFSDDGIKLWKDFLLANGLQNVSDYESFAVSKKSTSKKFFVKIVASFFPGKAEGGAKSESGSEQKRTEISASPSNLIELLRQSIGSDSKVIIFVDDISDYLDESDRTALKTDLSIIKRLLLSLQSYNLGFSEDDKNFRFVSLVREDIFGYMVGSNINKLKSDSLQIEWTEKDFASLVIRRMPYFADNLEKALENPVESLKKRFPDQIFSEFLKAFSTNRYGSNFYAYMAAISFNRPRDFLQFCYALRNRLSLSSPATLDNIEAAETEYSDYFIQELRDELYIASRVFDYDFSDERINQLIDIFSKKDEFNASQLKSDLSKFLGTKTSVGHKKIEMLVSELWRYGVIGVSEKKERARYQKKSKRKVKEDKVILFKYLSSSAVFTSEKVKGYTYYLHRGLWWFARKRR